MPSQNERDFPATFPKFESQTVSQWLAGTLTVSEVIPNRPGRREGGSRTTCLPDSASALASGCGVTDRRQRPPVVGRPVVAFAGRSGRDRRRSDGHPPTRRREAFGVAAIDEVERTNRTVDVSKPERGRTQPSSLRAPCARDQRAHLRRRRIVTVSFSRWVSSAARANSGSRPIKLTLPALRQQNGRDQKSDLFATGMW
jgi:hypothetical protein